MQDLSEELRHNAPLLVKHHLHRGVMQRLQQARRDLALALALALALPLHPRLSQPASHCISVFPQVKPDKAQHISSALHYVLAPYECAAAPLGPRACPFPGA